MSLETARLNTLAVTFLSLCKRISALRMIQLATTYFLENWAGPYATELNWFESYLKYRNYFLSV